MFKKVLAFFLALPKNQQRFITSMYFNRGQNCACALGALHPELQTMREGFQGKAIDDLILDEIIEPDFLTTFDITAMEARQLQNANDRERYNYTTGFMHTPEERFLLVMEWLKEKVKREETQQNKA